MRDEPGTDVLRRFKRFRFHVSYANAMSTLAVVIALVGSSAAYAAATIGSRDVIDNSLKSEDVRNDDSRGGGLRSKDVALDTLKQADLGPASVGLTELDPLAFNASDINSELGPFEIAANAVQGGEVSADTLTGSDVAEPTLTPLDGHDSYDSTCDPGSNTFLVCDELSFTLGRAMEVSVSWAYGFGTDGGVHPFGQCTTTLNGTNKSGLFGLISEDDSDRIIGGPPILDVMSLPAGTHTVGFNCNELDPDNSDLVIRNLYMSVVELGFD